MENSSGFPGPVGSHFQGAAFSAGAASASGSAPTTATSPPSPSDNTPNYKLFDVTSIVLATFLGTLMAGGLVMAINFRRAGQTAEAIIAFLVGVALSGLAILVGYAIPNALRLAFAGLVLFGVRKLAQATQGDLLYAHGERGGKLVSRWAAAAIGLLVLALTLAVASGVLYAQAAARHVAIGTKDEIQISGDSTRADGMALGETLKKIGYFQDRGARVLLEKDDSFHLRAVTFFIQDGSWNEPATIFRFEEVGRNVAPSIGGYPLEVRLADKNNNTQKYLNIGRKTFGGWDKDDIYYLGDATEVDASNLGSALQDAGYFSDQGVTVLLAEGPDGTAISFAVAEGTWDQPQKIEGYKTLVKRCAPAVGRLPIKLRFVDRNLQLKKEVPVS